MRNEQERTEGFSTGPAPFSDPFQSGGGTAVAEGQVRVTHGFYNHHWPLSGMTVGQARYELAERMNIDPTAVATIDGNIVAEDTVLAEGQVLAFIKHAGEKG
jgi:hypothetical protein